MICKIPGGTMGDYINIDAHFKNFRGEKVYGACCERLHEAASYTYNLYRSPETGGSTFSVSKLNHAGVKIHPLFNSLSNSSISSTCMFKSEKSFMKWGTTTELQGL
jgi:hypothetical protein